MTVHIASMCSFRDFLRSFPGIFHRDFRGISLLISTGITAENSTRVFPIISCRVFTSFMHNFFTGFLPQIGFLHGIFPEVPPAKYSSKFYELLYNVFDLPRQNISGAGTGISFYMSFS